MNINMMSEVIPEKNDPHIKDMIAEIRRSDSDILPDVVPVVVPVSPAPYAKVNGCFPAVKEKVNRDGGSMLLGWTLRKGSFLMSAEFHAVWKSPRGELLDVTPKGTLMPDGRYLINPVDNILFVPAPHAKYEGRQVENVNLNFSGNPLADDFIDCAHHVFGMMNRGSRATQHGEIKMFGAEGAECERVCLMQEILGQMIRDGQSSESPCFCGSGERYTNCHRKILYGILKKGEKP